MAWHPCCHLRWWQFARETRLVLGKVSGIAKSPVWENQKTGRTAYTKATFFQGLRLAYDWLASMHRSECMNLLFGKRLQQYVTGRQIQPRVHRFDQYRHVIAEMHFNPHTFITNKFNIGGVTLGKKTSMRAARTSNFVAKLMLLLCGVMRICLKQKVPLATKKWATIKLGNYNMICDNVSHYNVSDDEDSCDMVSYNKWGADKQAAIGEQRRNDSLWCHTYVKMLKTVTTWHLSMIS